MLFNVPFGKGRESKMALLVTSKMATIGTSTGLQFLLSDVAYQALQVFITTLLQRWLQVFTFPILFFILLENKTFSKPSTS